MKEITPSEITNSPPDPRPVLGAGKQQRRKETQARVGGGSADSDANTSLLLVEAWFHNS